MNSKLEDYIKNCDEKYEFTIIEDTNDEAYEKITRPHLKDCKNPDGSGPNKDRVPESKITNGFIYITAKNKETGELCGAESFQIYRLTNQAIPACVYELAMNRINATEENTYTDLKEFINDYKSKFLVLETHRLMSWVRGDHLASVMIHKLEMYAREIFSLNDPPKMVHRSTTMVPYLLFFGCCFLSMFKYDIISKLNGLMCVGIVIVGIILLAIMDRIIRLFHNEYIVNLGRL